MASVQAGLIDRLIRRLHLFGEDGADVRALRGRIDRFGEAGWPRPGVAVRPLVAGGVPAERVIPPGAPRDRCLLYLHGGAWCMGSPRTHRGLVADLASRAAVRAVSVDYRLAPEHPYPASLDDCVAAYGWLLERRVEPSRVVVAGDSAGGNLAAALLLRLRDAGIPLPAGAVLLSPVTDLALTGASHVTRKAVDPFFANVGLVSFIEDYVGSHDVAEPYISPLYADLRGLPPLLIHVGDHEVLLDDSVRLGERAVAAGVDATTVVWPGMMHVFQTFAPFLPEARTANREIAAFIRARIGD
jgi:epsilon-lactone hydrolase